MRVLGVIAAGVILTSCHAWTLSRQSVTQLVAADPSVVIRITTVEGQAYELESPRIVDDTIVAGWRNIGDRRDPRFDMPRVAVSDVRSTETRGVSAVRTAGFLALLGGAFYLAAQYAVPTVFEEAGFDPTAPPPPPPPSCVVTGTCG